MENDQDMKNILNFPKNSKILGKRAENGLSPPEYKNFGLVVEISVETSKKNFFDQNAKFEKGPPKCFRGLQTYFFGF